MSMFDTILSKLGVGSSKASPPPAAQRPTTSTASSAQQRPTSSTTAAPQASPRATPTQQTPPTQQTQQTQPTQQTQRTQPPAPATPAASETPTPGAATVDIEAELEQRAAASPQKLNWRTSIVDLLKLLDMDSSLTARKSLATELGCPAELMSDSAKMNVWLHKTVLTRVAANGGKVPQDLLN